MMLNSMKCSVMFLIILSFIRCCVYDDIDVDNVGAVGVEDNLGLNPQETLSLKHRGLQIIRCSAVHCSTVQCTSVQLSIVQLSAIYYIHCRSVQCTSVQCIVCNSVIVHHEDNTVL